MTKEKLQILMKKIDNRNTPKHWISFVKENLVDHNVILKYGNKAFCTHCQKYFDKKITVYKWEKCPYCNNKYFTRNSNIRNITYKKDIAFYSKVDGNIVLRVFEIESKFNHATRSFEHDLQEFARFIPNIGIIINDSVSFYMWYQKVWHNYPVTNWHVYTGNKVLNDMPIYPYNKDILFKNTTLQYAPMEEFKKEYHWYTDFEVMQLASYQSFEILWKMGLHKLSQYPKRFNKKGGFLKRFGVPKKFLKFMVENNIDYGDYSLLKLLQIPDMKLIQKYRHFNYNYLSFMKKQGFLYDYKTVEQFSGDFYTLKNICKYTSLKKFLQYKKGIKNIHIYLDYLEMASKLGISLKSKKRLFPYQLIAWHDKFAKKIKINEDMDTQFKAYLRYLDLSKYTYKDDKYIIFPAPSIDDLKDEGTQQENCVVTYLHRYINNETEIYLIRELLNPNKSFITLEYKNNHVVQKELPHHSIDFTDEQNNFIDKWLGFRSFIEQKEKYKKKQKIKVIKYNFKKMAA